MRTDLQPAAPLSVDPSWRIGIVSASYYKEEAGVLIDEAISTLEEQGILRENILLSDVSGSFEIPLIGAALATEKKVDALIGLGIIVEGETQHARLVAENVARGLMDIQIKYRVPFAYEVLYVDSLDLARKRLDKGKEAALSVLHSLAELAKLTS